MIRIAVGIVLLAAACARAPSAPSETGPPGAVIRVLMLTATAGFRHESIATAREVMSALAAASGWTLTTTEDLAMLSAARLATVDVVMFANTSGELPVTDAQREALLTFVNAGRGFVGTHSATDTLREWPDYGRLVGGYVTDHPWTQPARVIVEDPAHPATGVREAFTLQEEFYVFGENPRPRVSVLLRLDSATVGSTGDFPLAWAQSVGGGRSYYNALGHFASTWRDARFQQQLAAGIRWASGK